MKDPKQLREHTRRCRNLAKTAIEPGVIELLRVWSVELADKADAADRGKPELRYSGPAPIT